MRKLFLLLIILQSYHATSQEIEGQYRDYFSHSIDLREDKTFLFEYRFDLSSGWAKGVWSFNESIVSLTPILVMDTLSGLEDIDSLVLSFNKASERVTREEYLITQLASGGQLHKLVPEQLAYKNKRLYLLDDKRRIEKKKIRGMQSTKKRGTWYFLTK